MKLNKLISRKIHKKLSFTNGWAIDKDRYEFLCNELAEDLIKTISSKTNEEAKK